MSRFGLLEEVLWAAKDENVPFDILPVMRATAVRRELITKFAPGTTEGERMWEHLVDAAQVRHPGAWQWLSDFLAESPALLLFDVEEEAAVIRFKSGDDLVRIIAATTGFEFYVADPDAAFLLAFNHHDYLLGTGTAKDWVHERHPRLD